MTPAVIATEGGTFDRSEAPAFFSAGCSHEMKSRVHPRHTLVAVNDIDSAGKEREFGEFLDAGYVVLLDSGIFNLTNEHKRATGCTMDYALGLAPEVIPGFDELFERYVHLATTYGPKLWGYIELDQGGKDNKRRTRERLHDLGLNPIPVYHPLNDGWDYFDELASGYDRLCFGNVVQASQAGRVRLLHTMWERRRQYPDLWVHVLGLTANEWCLATPPDSCDSSSWINPLRYPKVTGTCVGMRQVGDIGHEFAYTHDSDSDRVVAVRVYGETMTETNQVWHAMQERVTELGAAPHPKRLPKEGPLCPST